MGDKVKGLIVTLEETIHIDDFENLKTSMTMIKGVSKVDVIVANGNDIVIENKVKIDVEKKLIESFNNIINDLWKLEIAKQDYFK